MKLLRPRFIIRLLLAAVLLAVIHAGVLAINRHNVSIQVRVPEAALRALPMKIGPWTGKEVELDRQLFLATGAEMTENRDYRDDAGHAATLHIAAFSDFSHITPHQPDLCYTGNGWTATARKNVPLSAGDGATVAAQMITFEQQQARVQVLYWYQVGGQAAVDYDGVRRAIVKSRRAQTAPPLIKVLLQVPATDPAVDEKRLCSLAEPVFAWVRKVTYLPAASTSASE